MNLQPVPLIDVTSAREFLTRLLPPVIEVFAKLEASDGRLKFRPEIASMIEQHPLDKYPLLYEKLAQLSSACRTVLASGLDLTLPGTDISLNTPEDRGRFGLELFRELDQVEPALSIPVFQEDHQATTDVLADLDTESIAVLDQIRPIMTSLMLALFYEYMSIAVHGVKLSTLIGLAKRGDDEALGKAIQIDGRVLFAIPEFAARYARARTEDDTAFIAMIGRKSTRAQYKGYLTHKPIWLTVGCLDMLGLLPMSGEALLDFCNGVGANNGEYPIEDVKNILKLIANYDRYQI